MPRPRQQYHKRGRGKRDALFFGDGGEVPEASPVEEHGGGDARSFVGGERAAPPGATVIARSPTIPHRVTVDFVIFASDDSVVGLASDRGTMASLEQAFSVSKPMECAEGEGDTFGGGDGGGGGGKLLNVDAIPVFRQIARGGRDCFPSVLLFGYRA